MLPLLCQKKKKKKISVFGSWQHETKFWCMRVNFKLFDIPIKDFCVNKFKEYFNSSRSLIWNPLLSLMFLKETKSLFFYPNLFPIGFDTLLKVFNGLIYFLFIPDSPIPVWASTTWCESMVHVLEKSFYVIQSM